MFVNNIHKYLIFFQISVSGQDVVPIIASGDETKQPERDEREESDGQSGEGPSFRLKHQKPYKIIRYYILYDIQSMPMIIWMICFHLRSPAGGRNGSKSQTQR